MKVTIVTLMPSFLDNIKATLKAKGHEVRVFHPSGDSGKDIWKLSEDCNWADLIFCEFCQYPMDMVTNIVKNKPIIARMHRIEVYNPDFIKKVNWGNVSLLLITTNSIKEKFEKICSGRILPQNIHVYSRPCVDITKFKYVKRAFGDSVKLVIVGNVIPRKRAFDALQLLYDLPTNYGISIVGDLKDQEYFSNMQDYANKAGLNDRISILRKINHDVLPELFGDHDIVLGMSTEETAHYSIAEGMATGCFPVMSYWRDCENMYPKYAVHKGFVSLITKLNDWGRLPKEEKERLSLDSRDWAERNFDSKFESELILEVIGKLS